MAPRMAEMAPNENKKKYSKKEKNQMIKSPTGDRSKTTETNTFKNYFHLFDQMVATRTKPPS